MRIVLCSSAGHETPPPAYGSEITTWYMADELSARGHDVYLIAARGSRVPPKGGLFEMPLDVLRCTQTEGEFARSFAALYRECDVVHDMSSSHSFADASHEAGGNRHLTTINGISFVTPRNKHNVCVLSEAARQCALNGTSPWGPDYPQFQASPDSLPSCEVVHYGTETAFYHPSSRLPDDYVVYIGRPHPSKGVHVILEIARQMPEQHFKLAWRADHPDHVAYEAAYLAEAKPLENVEIIQLPLDGHHEAKRDLYQHAKAFLQPSQYVEAFGLTAIEALACGTPIILADRGSGPEIVQPKRTGFLCTTLEEYIEAIRAVGTVSRYNCRMDAITRFDKAIMCTHYLRLYRRILEGQEW